LPQQQRAHLEVGHLPGLGPNLGLGLLGCGRLLVELSQCLIEGHLQVIGACLFLVELFVEVAGLILQQALADPQLPQLLVLGYYLDCVPAARKTELQVGRPQRMFQLSVCSALVLRRRGLDDAPTLTSLIS